MKAILQTLAEGKLVPDCDFDQVFPENVRMASEIRWTPVEIARRAAELFVVDSETKVLPCWRNDHAWSVLWSRTASASCERRPRLGECFRFCLERNSSKGICAGRIGVGSIVFRHPVVERSFDP